MNNIQYYVIITFIVKSYIYYFYFLRSVDFVDTFYEFFRYLYNLFLNLILFSKNTIENNIYTSLIFIPLFTILLIKLYSRPVNQENFWGDFKTYLSNNKRLSIVLFILVVVFGMIGAGIVNLISLNEEKLKNFSIAGVISILILGMGIWLITPLLNFRYKFSFLKDYHSKTAEYIFKIFNSAQNLRISTKGIISVQLFELEENTLANKFIFNYKEVWVTKHKNSKVSVFSPNSVEVPIDFWDVLYEFKTQHKLNFDTLNNYTPSKPKSLFSRKKYVNSIYLLALNDFIRENYYRFPDKKQKSEKELLEEYKEFIKPWNVQLSTKINYKSTHYMTFFSLVEKPYKIYIDSEIKFESKIVLTSNISEPENNLIDFIYEADNLGDSKDKKFRKYYNLFLESNSINEGQKRFTILLVADKRFLPDKESASSIFEAML